MDDFKNGHMVFRSEKEDYLVHVQEELEGVLSVLRTQGAADYDKLTIREYVSLVESRVKRVMDEYRTRLFEISDCDVDTVPPEAT